MVLTGLELIDDVRRDQDGVPIGGVERAGRADRVALDGAIPAEFQTAQDVGPEVILDGGGDGDGFRRRAGRRVGREERVGPEVFATSVEAQFFRRLIRQIQGNRFSVHARCETSEVLRGSISVVIGDTHLQTLDGRVESSTDVEAGQISRTSTSNDRVLSAHDAQVERRASREAEGIRSRQGDRTHVGLETFVEVSTSGAPATILAIGFAWRAAA